MKNRRVSSSILESAAASVGAPLLESRFLLSGFAALAPSLPGGPLFAAVLAALTFLGLHVFQAWTREDLQGLPFLRKLQRIFFSWDSASIWLMAVVTFAGALALVDPAMLGPWTQNLTQEWIIRIVTAIHALVNLPYALTLVQDAAKASAHDSGSQLYAFTVPARVGHQLSFRKYADAIRRSA